MIWITWLKKKGQAPKANRYRGKKIRTKTQGMEPEPKNKFKGRWSDPEGYILDLGTRSSYKFSRTMKEMELYLGTTYRNSCQPEIIIKTTETFSDPDMPTIISDTGVECPDTDADMNYLEKKNIDKAICQKSSNKDVYETVIHNIYNIIVGQTNNK